jgi:hypothetical protein
VLKSPPIANLQNVTGNFMRTVILIILTLFQRTILSQTYLTSATDTLEIRGDSVLVILKSFQDNSLKAEVSCFLIPDSILVPKYTGLFRNHFKKWIPATKLVRHGNTIEYLGQISKKNSDGQVIQDFGDVRRLTIYNLGQQISLSYYNSHQDKISEENIPTQNIRGPCSTSTDTYLFYGTKEN